MAYIIEAFVWEGLRKVMKILRIEAGFQDEAQTPCNPKYKSGIAVVEA
jgi:hypothetical protein